MADYHVTLIVSDRELIIKNCKDRVEKDGMAYIKSVAHALHIDIDANEEERIAHILYSTNEYEKGKDREQGYYVLKNPNKELSESVKKTNEAVQRSFVTQKSLTIYSLLLTGLSIIFIGISALIQWYDQTPKEVQSLRLQVQKSSQSLDSIAAYLREANSSKKNIDTVYLISPAHDKTKN